VLEALVIAGLRGRPVWDVEASLADTLAPEKALDPPAAGRVIDGDTALGHQLRDVPVGQPVPQVTARCDRDHRPRESETANSEDAPDDVTTPVCRPLRSTNAKAPWLFCLTTKSVNGTSSLSQRRSGQR